MSTDCPRELTQQSPHHNLGTIQDEEPVIYVLLEPDHYKNGELQKAAFSNSKLKDGNLSVCRSRHSSKEEVQREVIDSLLQSAAAKGRGSKFVGVFRAMCVDIRRIYVDYPRKSRAVCVIDDGQPNYKAHAHLSYSVFAQGRDYWARNSRAAVRANLIEAFGRGKMLSLDDVFGSQPA